MNQNNKYSIDFSQHIITLCNNAISLHNSIQNATDESTTILKTYLNNSVIRPLKIACAEFEKQGNNTSANTEGEQTFVVESNENLHYATDKYLWYLAQQATALIAAPGDNSELLEATAALQRLAVDISDANIAAERQSVLQKVQSVLPARIKAEHNGPYLTTNIHSFYNWLGEALPAFPQMALCRCGGSPIKPFCDGTHAVNGFEDSKDANRVADKRDTYIGQQLTIYDNRGICQHSGLCTDRIATVFRLGREPFIAPSGGRMDEIIRAVRDCPSGALSYAIDDNEARNQVDHHNKRNQNIEVTKDGPYRITGAITLQDENGDVRRNEGSSHEHYALCRCGKSQNKPFCSGMHWYVGFTDPESKEEPTIFEWAGGYPAMLRMTRLFYEKHVPNDDLLGPLFATMADDHPQRVAKWLSEVFCGPPDYSKEYGGYNRMLSQHINKQLTEEQRARWVKLLSKSAQEAMLPNDAEFRSAFGSYIEWGSRLAVENSQTQSRPPEHMPMPHWDWNTAAGAPGSRISALAPPEKEAEIVYPADNEPVTFDKHIKQLFRKKDRQSMSFVFDLWKYDDVKKYADEIVKRLENGSMPCDGAWPKEKLQIFTSWCKTGMLN